MPSIITAILTGVIIILKIPGASGAAKAMP